MCQLEAARITDRPSFMAGVPGLLKDCYALQKEPPTSFYKWLLVSCTTLASVRAPTETYELLFINISNISSSARRGKRKGNTYCFQKARI